jgi:hypothetical protein
MSHISDEFHRFLLSTDQRSVHAGLLRTCRTCQIAATDCRGGILHRESDGAANKSRYRFPTTQGLNQQGRLAHHARQSIIAWLNFADLLEF